MPGCTIASGGARRKGDYFQRRKVGSIRDNPKLMKIRQQFESASKKLTDESGFKEMSSAPSSVSISKKSDSCVLSSLFKNGSRTDSFSQNKINSSPTRRHSEGEINNNSRHLSIYESIGFSSGDRFKTDEQRIYPFQTTGNNLNSCSTNKIKVSDVLNSNSTLESNSEGKCDFRNSCSDSSTNTSSPNSKETALDCTKIFENKVPIKTPCNSSSSSDITPPIPRRGVSSSQNSFLHSNWDSKQNKCSLFRDFTSKAVNEPTSVQKAIELYEGMSSHEKRNVSIKRNCTQQRVTSSSKKSHIIRRNSRHNSFRKSKTQKDSVTTSIDRKNAHKEEENEDKSQSIYQTLTTTVNVSHALYDPYDRLSRIHDVVNHIHKGQPSACAACKAIPASVLQFQDTESSLLEVKCTEQDPHHHPPCICFSCRHSVFSCSINSDSLSSDANEDSSFYYNMCCLNPPNRDSWRQSRRRPVCELNGRLCVVNCNMEKCGSKVNSMEEQYDILSECRSLSPSAPKDSVKQSTGDSCESDEGWVDVTDSEDEKSVPFGRFQLPHSKITNNNPSCQADESVTKCVPYDIDDIVTKCSNLDLSKSLSTEHLYETISDVNSDGLDETEVKDILNNSSKSSNYSFKNEHNPENELDSGEWSTESQSSVSNEFSKKSDQQKSNLNQFRFTVNYESQETAAKKTFMKSVLGKKTANPKKRRMSNFFVPWLASNGTYTSSNSNISKMPAKKQVCHQSSSSKQSSNKSKRSLSMSLSSPKSSKKIVFCSTDVLDKSESSVSDAGSNSMILYPDSDHSIISRGSVASSAYLSADQLHTSNIPLRKGSLPSESSTEVFIERISKLSPSGNSEHSYILFKPIKEEDVPLYQFYERNIKERVSFCRSPKSLSPTMWTCTPENSPCTEVKSLTPQLSVTEQLSPDATDLKMLWCELPEVKESGILERISAQELKLQEAIFEFIQSQASYMRSLKVLYENFITMPEFSDVESPLCVLSKHEQDVLFSDIIRVKEVSERILSDITDRWSDDILIPDICDIINYHVQLPAFSVYIKYCSNRIYQERTLKELKESRLCFLEALRKLENNPLCQGLSLESFLFLPMQHIARLPLLIDNIFKWLVPDSPSYSVCKLALETVHKIFVECNEGARKMERVEEMFILNKQLEFKECKVIPLISASRWLLKKGEFMKLEFDKKTFGRSNRCVKVPVFIFLFNDLLVITRRKSDDCYTVIDYCSREKVHATAVSGNDIQLPLVAPNVCRYLIYLKLLSNHQCTEVDMILNCPLMSERTRWIEAIQSVPLNKSSEISEYDCPQVQCFKNYVAQQPDELSLQESDVVTIYRKMNDGWYEGRRLRDGLQGWFPASHTMDIPCSRARASNLRQCYRLLMLSHPK